MIDVIAYVLSLCFYLAIAGIMIVSALCYVRLMEPETTDMEGFEAEVERRFKEQGKKDGPEVVSSYGDEHKIEDPVFVD